VEKCLCAARCIKHDNTAAECATVSVVLAGGAGMMWFIVWMLLSADEPVQDSGLGADEKDYIIACLNTSQTHQHQRFSTLDQVTLHFLVEH